jgi:hypothetical protein
MGRVENGVSVWIGLPPDKLLEASRRADVMTLKYSPTIFEGLSTRLLEAVERGDLNIEEVEPVLEHLHSVAHPPKSGRVKRRV